MAYFLVVFLNLTFKCFSGSLPLNIGSSNGLELDIGSPCTSDNGFEWTLNYPWTLHTVTLGPCITLGNCIALEHKVILGYCTTV